LIVFFKTTFLSQITYIGIRHIVTNNLRLAYNLEEGKTRGYC